mmetsp:Transcript_225/g.205  ORF Transcript_225/g.205 Transcript_225/m.205 type:complete len:325 (-) Transcript_225:199-1173(-)
MAMSSSRLVRDFCESDSIDCHTHVYLPTYMDILRERSSRNDVPFVKDNRLVILPGEDVEQSTKKGRPIGPEYSELKVKQGFMKKHCIGKSVISLANPWLDFLNGREAVETARKLNIEMNKLCEESEGSLYGFGVLPTNASVEACVKEVEFTSSSLQNIRGFIVGTHGRGNGLDDLSLEPLWKAFESHHLTVFVHPHYGVGNEHFAGTGHSLMLALGFPFETTVAVSRWILSGVFDRVPDLKVLLAHAGGTLPFLAGRLDSCVKGDAVVGNKLKNPPSWYLRKFYYDAVGYHAPSLRCTIDFVGIDRIVFGTDHPFFPASRCSGG